MSPRVAIVGANGFIGSRTVESFHLQGSFEVRPIVRSASALARLSRFDLDCRIADALDERSMRSALEGCDAVVHSVAGPPETIERATAPVYLAAQQAGVRRLIYLSSGAVHGQSPAPGTDESSPLDDRQPIAYNNAKVHAEQNLLALREKGSVQLVILRPGIVTGPRSYWVESFASELLAGSAYLMGDGKGVCNSIYVDNLVHALRLAIESPDADGHAFIVGDEETLTWADLYNPIAEALGFDLGKLADASQSGSTGSWRDRCRAMLVSAPIQSASSILPSRVKRALRAGFSALLQRSPRSPWVYADRLRPARSAARPTLEMALLYQCRYKLPDAKARRVLGYRPIVPFPQAVAATIGWLAFAGYPVISELATADANGKDRGGLAHG